MAYKATFQNVSAGDDLTTQKYIQVILVNEKTDYNVLPVMFT